MTTDEPERGDAPPDGPRDARELLHWVDADRLGRTPEHPCGYLPERVARERGFFAERLDGETYHELMDRGFRRNGPFFYATACPSCRACVPLRVPVSTFRPTRSQRRVLRRNGDVTVSVHEPAFSPEAHELYRRYLRHQHPGGAQRDDEASFRELFAPVVDSVEIRYLLGERLVATSLLDVCARSVSAVYHFFDPEHARRSLGVFSVLAEIEWARRLGVPFYYLGYWIQDARTMRYKADYRPHQTLVDGSWR